MFARALPPLVLSLLVLASPVAAQQVPTQAAVTRALSGFEEQPDASSVRAWGVGVIPVLAAVIDDGDAIIAVRARAAYALRAFGAEPGARAILQRVAADEGANVFIRRAAIDALIDGGDAVSAVTPLLTAPDPDVRAGAVLALARSRQVSVARAALDARSRVERDASVRVHIAETLRRMPAR